MPALLISRSIGFPSYRAASAAIASGRARRAARSSRGPWSSELAELCRLAGIARRRDDGPAARRVLPREFEPQPAVAPVISTVPGPSACGDGMRVNAAVFCVAPKLMSTLKVGSTSVPRITQVVGELPPGNDRAFQSQCSARGVESPRADLQRTGAPPPWKYAFRQRRLKRSPRARATCVRPGPTARR